MKKYLSKNENDTVRFAEAFAKKLYGGEVVALIGGLGTGKTIFTKGLARGLGIKQIIHSPTFLLMKIYYLKKAKKQKNKKIKILCHVDAYRLFGPDELIDIGLLDWLGRKDTITIIEWADKVKSLLKGKKVIKVRFKFGKKENERIILVGR